MKRTSLPYDYVASHALLGGLEFGPLRIAGPGLGNMLLPWARALVWSVQNTCRMITPTWPQLKIGALLRGERDKRFYLSLFQPRAGEITGLRKQLILRASAWVDEDDALRRRAMRARPLVRVFSGLRDFFVTLTEHRELVRLALYSATRQHLHPPCPMTNRLHVHVRFGDFGLSDESRQTQPISSTTRVSANWYAQAIRDVVEAWPGVQEIRVFTDGHDFELGPILSIPNVRRVPERAAITDLLDLGNASVLIAAPQSTFSMWAKYLGDPITISLPVEDATRYGVNYEILEYDSLSRVALLKEQLIARAHRS